VRLQSGGLARRARDPGLRRVAVFGSAVVVWLLAGIFAVSVLKVAHSPAGLHTGYDSHAYWHAWKQGLYQQNLAVQFDRYLYSPAFADALWPLTRLPSQVFVFVWAGFSAGLFLWLLRPVPLLWRPPLFLFFCLHESLVGNVNALLGVMLVLGFRYPGLWSFALLTKVAPGVGLLWFVVRRDWNSLMVALATTIAVASASFVLAPYLWRDWFMLLLGGHIESQTLIPYAFQVPLAIALVCFAAVTSRPWLLAPAILLASPVSGVLTLSVLAAVPRLRADSKPDRVQEGGRGASVRRE
jgi:hypothetical protein